MGPSPDTALMISPLMRCSWLVAASFFALGATDLPIRFNLVQGRPVVNSVYLNGVGPFRFLLDTGAETSQVHKDVARRLGLHSAYRVRFETIAGSEMLEGTHIASIQLQEFKATNREVLFTDMALLHALDRHLDGVLGADFLCNFDFTLDFRRQTISALPLRGKHIPVSIAHGLIYADSSRGPMLIDSGSDAVILPGRPIRGETLLTTAAGHTNAVAQSPQLITVGDQQFRPRHQAVASGTESFAAGIIPANLFQRISISHSGRYIVVE